MTEIRFLNGLQTIGGNIVEFSQGASRVIMDFGVAADLTDETPASAIANGKLPNVQNYLARLRITLSMKRFLFRICTSITWAPCSI